MAIVQQDRLILLNTPLGKDVLLVETLEGVESISNLFRFNLVLVSEKRDIALNSLVGQKVTIGVELPGKKFRYINGFVSRFSQGDVDARVSHYYAEVVPWLWFLTRTSDCRIFQKKTVPDIIKQIFKDLGFTDFKMSWQGSFEPREYCVQYRETDFDFISRLAQEEGIFYFFEHGEDKHTMVLSNDPGVHAPCPNQAKARYGYLTSGAQDEDMVTRWHQEQELQPGKYTHTDYYFQTPSNSLQVSTPSAVKVGGNDKFEVYDYPGGFAKRFDGDDKAGKVRPDGERTAKLRMQGDEAFHKVVNGAGSCRAFTPGYKFELTEHRRADLNGPYVLTQVSHSATNDLGGGGGATYDSTFSCIPLAVPYRPARSTPRPIVHGTQTAVVVGLGGEEIDTDKYGRVKVQFHWDREGKKNQDSSCWVRVATPWAGKQWGMIHIPRIGQEVIVDFLEGDPDQPIIVGSVYNAEMMPIYELPGNKTWSGIKTRSTLTGSPENCNEIGFEDKKGSELFYMRAEKDHTVAVENDETKWVGHDRWEEVDHDRTLIVGQDKFETVHRNKKITVDMKHEESIGKDMSVMVGSNLTEVVAINYAETVGAAMELTVGGLLAVSVGAMMTESVGLSKTEAVGGSKTESIMGDRKLNVGKDLKEEVDGNQSVTIAKDLKEQIDGQHKSSVKKEYFLKAKKIQLTADDEISIKTGKAEIVMKKNGDITINGKKITVKGSGDVIVKGSKIKEN
ncbi:MAG: type VI secretion system tip protein VgrG [Gemmataceae bacterium]|nr:type VI secretion system tip protein VgrG [Gemmataceae bacterium]MCI0738263.1 type VI secretion system tip protein VgrG [Gemmataceae bacterium]